MYAQGFAEVIMRKESFAHMMQQMDNQMASAALKSALSIAASLATAQGRKHLNDARTAAADAWASAGNPVLGAIEAAATFSAVMALETGGIVPGVTRGDTVPAMLTPGEAVLPKRLTEQLTHASASSGSAPQIHVHYAPTNHIQALDSDGVDKVLTEHKETFHRHFEDHVRKMNH
jgi:hypothetical protein